MAPASPAPDLPDVRQREANQLAAYGLLRDLHKEVQNFQEMLAELKQARKAAPVQESAVVLRLTLGELHERIPGNIEEVNEVFEKLDILIAADPSIHDHLGDQVTEAANRWQTSEQHLSSLAGEAKKSASDFDAEKVVEWSDRAEEALRKIILLTARVTIPARLNQHLETVRVGQPLSFSGQFEDELPDENDRKSILKYLVDHPDSVYGIIDIDKGAIYKADRRRGRRVLSWVLAFGVPLLGGLLVFLLTLLADRLNFVRNLLDPDRTEKLLQVYLLIFVGALLHILITIVKQSKSGEESLASLGDWAMWVHVRERSILGANLALIFVFIMIAYFREDVSPATAVFVGYGIDSFVDIFLKRFETIAKTKTEALTTQFTSTTSS